MIRNIAFTGYNIPFSGKQNKTRVSQSQNIFANKTVGLKNYENSVCENSDNSLFIIA